MKKNIAAALLVASAGAAFADVNLAGVDRSGYEVYTGQATAIGTP